MLKSLMKMAKPVENVLDMVLTSQAGTLIKLFLVIYSSLVAPKLGNNVLEVFKNPLMKLVGLALVVYTGTKDLVLSLLIAVAFIITVMMISKMDTVKSVKDLIHLQVDTVQKFGNTMIDETQDVVEMAGDFVPEPISNLTEPLIDAGNMAVDAVQDVTNTVIDGLQDVLEASPVSF